MSIPSIFLLLKIKMVTAWGFPLHYFLAWLNSSFPVWIVKQESIWSLSKMSFTSDLHKQWHSLTCLNSITCSWKFSTSPVRHFSHGLHIYFRQCRESFVAFSLHCSKIFVRPCRNEYILIPILHFIPSQDYEYASYNPIAFDIANHFCEMAANYHSETPHVLDYSKYPGNFYIFSIMCLQNYLFLNM